MENYHTLQIYIKKKERAKKQQQQHGKLPPVFPSLIKPNAQAPTGIFQQHRYLLRRKASSTQLIKKSIMILKLSQRRGPKYGEWMTDTWHRAFEIQSTRGTKINIFFCPRIYRGRVIQPRDWFKAFIFRRKIY